jgi:hypothetical protein
VVESKAEAEAEVEWMEVEVEERGRRIVERRSTEGWPRG